METTPTTAVPSQAFCSSCGAPWSAGARFCHRCGAAAGGDPGRRAGAGGFGPALPWSVAALALIALVVLLAVQYAGRSPAAGGPPFSAGAGGPFVTAPDISQMSPDEQADRLFDRVMRLASEGKADSAGFFAPMAIGALEALAPLTAHRRYDLGLVFLMTGDPATAAAHADTILAGRSTHLLGLALAARAAAARGDAAAATAFSRRLIAAEAGERAAALPEYADHDTDIRSALTQARGGTP